MSNTFPTTLNDWSNGETIESAWADAIEDKIGVDSSAVTSSLDYKLKSTSSTDPGHKHTESSITLADNTTNDVSTTKHGFVPKAPNDTTKFLRGDGTFAVPSSSGAISQVQTKTDTGTYSSTATSLTEISTNWRLAITPNSASSKLRLRATFSVNSTNSEVHLFDFYDVTNSTAVGVGATSGSRRTVTTAYRGPGADANDSEMIIMEVIINATNTTARTYTIRTSTETSGSSTTYFNYTNTDSGVFGWTTPFTFTIDEIT